MNALFFPKMAAEKVKSMAPQRSGGIELFSAQYFGACAVGGVIGMLKLWGGEVGGFLLSLEA